jgi:hypothetical protein
LEADAALAVEVFELKVTICVLDRLVNDSFGDSFGLVSNNCWLSVNPIFGLEESQWNTLIGIIPEANFTSASVSSPVLIGLLTVVVYVDRNGLNI